VYVAPQGRDNIAAGDSAGAASTSPSGASDPHREEAVQKSNDQLQAALGLLQAAERLISSQQEHIQAAREELTLQNAALSAAENALDVERVRYRDLFESAPDGYLVTNSAGIILEANDAVLAMLGCDQETLVGALFIDRIRPEERPEFTHVIEGLRRHTPMQSLETRIAGAAGMQFDAEIAASVERTPHTRIASRIRWIIRDISRRKRNEERLRRQHAVTTGIAHIFREALTCETEEELGRVCLQVAESVTQSRFGFVGELNQEENKLEVVAVSDPGWEVCRIHGGAARGRQIMMHLQIHGLYGRVILDGKGFFANDPASHPDAVGVPTGHPPLTAFLGVPLTHKGRVVGMIGLGNREGGYREEDREAAESLAPAVVQAFLRMRSEQALKESENRLAMALDSGQIGMWEWDLRSSRSVWNPREYQLLGLPVGDGQVPTELFFKHVHPDDLAKFQCRLAETMKSGSDWTDECRIIRVDGQERWLACVGQVMRDENGDPSSMIGLNYDITDRKQLDQYRQQMLEAERAARMESERLVNLKDEFLATVSHELRSPLGAIVGWARLLARGKAETPKAIDIISRSAASLTRIIDDLLDASRMVSGKIRLKRERTSIVQIVSSALEGVQFAAESKGVHIELSVDPDLHAIECDPTRVQQIVWNLLTNAIKFTPAGGQVFVSVSESPQDVRIEVRDTGQGIAPAFLPHIFERFRQQDGSIARHHGGLGLGLTIVKQLAELHGGSVEVHSEGEGRGASFVVRLPRPRTRGGRASGGATSVRAERRVVEADECDLADVSVLAVDDDPFTRELMGRVLADAGAAVQVVASSREALAVLDDYQPDVIVSDIGMPGDDGLAFMRKLKEQGGWRADVPCLAVTALNRPEDRDRALQAGYREHLGKPFDPATLCMVIARILGRRPSARKPAAVKPRDSEKHAATATRSRRRAHVLLAEDSRNVSEIMKDALEEGGYQVSVAESLAEAARIAGESSVDVLVSDLRLKDGMGWDLLARLREKQPVPAIVISGYADEVYVTRSKAAGFAEYLVKPVDTDDVLASLGRVLNTRLR
jgi:PAS domain S-box-containing protein